MDVDKKAILIRCPATGKPVLTGLATNKATFLNLLIDSREQAEELVRSRRRAARFTSGTRRMHIWQVSNLDP